MSISVLEIFTIGIGPSSSHSVGPMRAARAFVASLAESGKLAACRRIEVRLYGSLALTGKGHGTDKAILLGIEGETPENIDPDSVESRVAAIRSKQYLQLADGPQISFVDDRDLLFLRNESLPYHPNGMTFVAYDEYDKTLSDETFFSIGGGFIVQENDSARGQVQPIELRYPFQSGNELLGISQQTGLPISSIMLANEASWRREPETRTRLLNIWHVMQQCVIRGCRAQGILPGGLKVRRRAADLHQALLTTRAKQDKPLAELDWVNVYAIAVSEENAAGGRIVTAPTNGAAGVIPAVLHYYTHFFPEADDDGIARFLLTAGAIAILYKLNASLSGAEVGCQGEIGVSCSMAAGALTEVLGGSPRQVEMAAEIGMEHNLGLTCDPIGGLVQVPCIERCAMAAVKAINASTMALNSDGTHHVSLDRVIRTMRETGRDMLTKYKETSRGGLAVAYPEC